jgi:hypothetical protein
MSVGLRICEDFGNSISIIEYLLSVKDINIDMYTYIISRINDHTTSDLASQHDIK